MEEREGLLGELGAGVGVAGQFDGDQALVADGGEGVEYGWEVDLSVAEGEVFVDAAAHVLDLDVAQPGGGGADAVGWREGFEALAVADVEGEAEGVGAAECGAQAVEVGEGGEEVAGFGFDGEGDSGGGGGVEDGGEGFGEALPAGGLGRFAGSRFGVRFSAPWLVAVLLREDAAEAVDRVGAEVGGDLDGPDEQVGAAGALVRVRVEEGRAVLAPRVEYVAGAGLDGDAQAEFVQSAGEFVCAGSEVGGQRVQVHVVERQTDAVVAEVGEEGEGVVQAEVGQAVGAVARSGGGVCSAGMRWALRERAAAEGSCHAHLPAEPCGRPERAPPSAGR